MSNYKMNIIAKVKGLIQYYDLGYVLDNLESLINLPTPYLSPKMDKETFANNKKLSEESQVSSEEKFRELTDEFNNRKMVFNGIREIRPDFCIRMKGTLSEKEYSLYLRLLKKCDHDISILIKSFSDRANNYDKLLMKKKDDFSRIIDSKSNSELSFLQDKFVLLELEKVDCSKLSEELQDKINGLKQELGSRITKYHKYEELISKKEIKFKSHVHSKEERE